MDENEEAREACEIFRRHKEKIRDGIKRLVEEDFRALDKLYEEYGEKMDSDTLYEKWESRCFSGCLEEVYGNYKHWDAEGYSDYVDWWDEVLGGEDSLAEGGMEEGNYYVTDGANRVEFDKEGNVIYVEFEVD